MEQKQTEWRYLENETIQHAEQQKATKPYEPEQLGILGVEFPSYYAGAVLVALVIFLLIRRALK